MRAATALAVAGLCAACGVVGWIEARSSAEMGSPADPAVKLEKRPLSDFNAAWPSKGR